MKGKTNTEGIDESGGFELMPKGFYKVEITDIEDTETKNGDPMVKLTLVVREGKYEDRKVWDVIVISNNPESPGYKILGRSKKFLHVIGEPFEGDIEWDSDNWIYKKCNVLLGQGTYKNKDGHMKDKNTVEQYLLEEELSGESITEEPLPIDTDEVPF